MSGRKKKQETETENKQKPESSNNGEHENNPTIQFQFDELKELLKTSNTNINKSIAELTSKINKNHHKLLSKISSVEETANNALATAQNNEKVIADLINSNNFNEEEIATKISQKVQETKNELTEKFQINRITSEIEAMKIELEDLKNRSMRSTLIIKNIPEEKNENSWEDTARVLGNFLSNELRLSYTPSEVDQQISRAHRSGLSNENKSKTKKGPRPIFVQFVNWRYAEEVRN